MALIPNLAVSPSRIQTHGACSPTKSVPGPEGFMVVTKPLHQHCLSKLLTQALLIGARHLAGRHIPMQLNTHVEGAGVRSVDNAMLLHIGKQMLLSWRWDRDCHIYMPAPPKGPGSDILALVVL